MLVPASLERRNSSRNEDPWTEELPEELAQKAERNAEDEDQFGHQWTEVGVPAVRTSAVSLAAEMGIPLIREGEVDQRELKRGYNDLNSAFSGREDYYFLAIDRGSLDRFADAEDCGKVVAGTAYFEDFDPEPCLIGSHEEAADRMNSEEFEDTWTSYEDWSDHTDYDDLMNEVNRVISGLEFSPVIAPLVFQQKESGAVTAADRQVVMGSDGGGVAEAYDNSHLEPGGGYGVTL